MRAIRQEIARELQKVEKEIQEAKTRARGPVETPAQVRAFLGQLYNDDLYVKQILSLANAVTGVLHAAACSIHAIGAGLALATGKNPKHTTKQVDRMLSNGAIDVWKLFENWVRFVVGERKEIVTALDWTEFDKDNQATIALHLVTSHGRTTPLVWKTVYKTERKDQRNNYEDEVIERLHAILPVDVQVTVLADRGFGDQLRYQHLDVLGWDYVIRFRGDILVMDVKGTQKQASEWIPPNGRSKKLRNARVTRQQTTVGAVVCVHRKKMKDPWCLATSRAELTSTQIIQLYGRRFTIEETFRDTKDPRYGLGLSATHVKHVERRDRIILIATIAQSLLTLLGAAAESIGLDRMLKVNTSTKRTHSLFRQGRYWYQAIPNMPKERLRELMTAFGQIIMEHTVFRDVFGIV